MKNQSLQEAAVEAAAKGIHLERWPDAPWGALNSESRDYARKLARLALEAAAPHMLANVSTRVEQVNLPIGTVILSEQGGVFQHFNGYWFEPGSSCRHHLDDITLPATVIHRPTP